MAAIAALIACLQSEDAVQRANAAQQLALLGAEARPAATDLVRACGDQDDQVRQWASGALEEMGPPLAADAAALTELLNHDAADVAYWAATLLGRLGGEARAAVPALAAALQADRALIVRQRAAWALGEIGVAIGARAALEAAASAADPRLARLAREALDKVQ